MSMETMQTAARIAAVTRRAERRLSLLLSKRRRIVSRYVRAVAERSTQAEPASLAGAARQAAAVVARAAGRLTDLFKRQRQIVARFLAGAEAAKIEEARDTIEHL